MSELQKLVDLDPENLYAKGKLGEFYLPMRKDEEAKKIPDELVDVRPDDPKGHAYFHMFLVRGAFEKE